MFQDPLFQSNVLASLCVCVCVFVLAGGQRADSWKQHARCRHHRLCVCVCVCVCVWVYTLFFQVSFFSR